MEFLQFTGKVFLSLLLIWFVWYVGSVVLGTILRKVTDWHDDICPCHTSSDATTDDD